MAGHLDGVENGRRSGARAGEGEQYCWMEGFGCRRFGNGKTGLGFLLF